MKRLVKAVLVFAAAVMLAGCGNSESLLDKKTKTTEATTEETTEKTDEEILADSKVASSHFEAKEITGLEFPVYAGDLDVKPDEIEFNKLRIRDDLPASYSLYETYYDRNEGITKYYEAPDRNYDGKFIEEDENFFMMRSDNCFYYAVSEKSVGDSLRYATSISEVEKILMSLNTDECVNSISLLNDDYKYTEDGKEKRLTAGITFSTPFIGTIKGAIVIIEDEKGQSMYIGGGFNITDTDILYMRQAVKRTENKTTAIADYKKYRDEKMYSDYNGCLLTIDYPDILGFNYTMNNVERNFEDNHDYGKRFISANTYLKCTTYYACHTKRIKNISKNGLEDIILPYGKNIVSEDTVTGNDGTVWYEYVIRENPDYFTNPNSYCFCTQTDKKIFMIRIYIDERYENDIKDMISSITIKKGQSIEEEIDSDVDFIEYIEEEKAKDAAKEAAKKKKTEKKTEKKKKSK